MSPSVMRQTGTHVVEQVVGHVQLAVGHSKVEWCACAIVLPWIQEIASILCVHQVFVAVAAAHSVGHSSGLAKHGANHEALRAA